MSVIYSGDDPCKLSDFHHEVTRARFGLEMLRF